MIKPSSMFFERTKKRSVYNIQPIQNIPSVMEYGILSYKQAEKLRHESIAMKDVQIRRDKVIIPNGLPLHSYANAYFDPRNPMMYSRQKIAESLCVLAISSQVLDFEGTVVSDGNAASSYTRFYSPEEGIEQLDFVRIYSKWWIDEDQYIEFERKRIKCAEILVVGSIPFDLVVGACVSTKSGYENLKSSGFDKPIRVTPKIFFQ